MNNITIHGHLAREPELKEYTNAKGESGKLCKFAVAVNRRFGEEADFFNCIIFGKGAEVIKKFFHKGSEIAVSGEMQCNPYTPEGSDTKRYPWTLQVQQFDFCGKKDGNGAPAAGSAEAPQDSFEEIDEDVPF